MTLKLAKASVIRSGRAILDRVSVGCAPGEVTALCGPNGAGKTTALKLLSGSQSPDQGAALLDDRELRTYHREDLARRRAMVAQHPILSFPFRVHEIVEMGRAPHAKAANPGKDAEAVDSALAAMALHDLSDRNYLTLSGGERQRVMIARALAQIWFPPGENQARWLLLDEPTSALDLKHQLGLMKRLAVLATEGWGIIIVLHDLALVKQYADRVMFFQDGRLHSKGVPETVMTAELIQDVFGLDEPYALARA